MHTDPELASKWLNGFIKMVERETSKNIVDGVTAVGTIIVEKFNLQ